MMKSFVVIGDLHLLLDDQRLKVFSDFWDYFLKEIHQDGEDIIFLGDIFDKSLMSGEVIDLFIEKLQQAKNSHKYILQGNHDYTKQFHSIITPLNRFKNITVIDELTVKDLLGNKCLFLPYRYTAKEDYKDITGTYDYIFAHITDPEDQFSNEGIEIKAKGHKLYGHNHQSNKRCLGVPYPTRFGEQYNDFRLARIFEDKHLEYIKLPKFFDYVSIEHGDEVNPANMPPNFKLIIENAPNRKLAKEKYKGYKIYKVNILTEELKLETKDSSDQKKSLGDLFEEWAKKNTVEKPVYLYISKLLSKTGVKNEKESV